MKSAGDTSTAAVLFNVFQRKRPESLAFIDVCHSTHEGTNDNLGVVFEKVYLQEKHDCEQSRKTEMQVCDVKKVFI